MFPVPFISLIVKQFKFYVSCVSLPQVQPRLVARYLVNSLVPMNVREKKQKKQQLCQPYQKISFPKIKQR